MHLLPPFFSSVWVSSEIASILFLYVSCNGVKLCTWKNLKTMKTLLRKIKQKDTDLVTRYQIINYCGNDGMSKYDLGKDSHHCP